MATIKKEFDCSLRVEIKFNMMEVLVSIPMFALKTKEISQEQFDDAVKRYLLSERLNISDSEHTNAEVYRGNYDEVWEGMTYYMDMEFVDVRSKNKFKLTNPSLSFI